MELDIVQPDGKLRKIPRKELRASLVNELDWFNTQEKDGE